jgi:hypothetical protein
VKAWALFEKRVVEFLSIQTGYALERRVMGGQNDRGDVSGLPDRVVEVKTGAISLGTAMNEAKKEAANAKVTHYVVVNNRRSHELSRSYATVELWEYAHLLRCEQRCREAGLL